MNPSELWQWLVGGVQSQYAAFKMWLAVLLSDTTHAPKMTWNVNEMSDATLMTLTIVNIVICAALFKVCIGRVRVMNRDTTKKMFRANYAFLMVASLASGASYWLFGEQAGPAQILLGAAAFAFIGTGSRNWDDGPPSYARYAHLRNVPAQDLETVAAERQEGASDGRDHP